MSAFLACSAWNGFCAKTKPQSFVLPSYSYNLAQQFTSCDISFARVNSLAGFTQRKCQRDPSSVRLLPSHTCTQEVLPFCCAAAEVQHLQSSYEIIDFSPDLDFVRTPVAYSFQLRQESTSCLSGLFPCCCDKTLTHKNFSVQRVYVQLTEPLATISQCGEVKMARA